MSDELKSIQNYIHAIEKALAMDDATEHTHRAATLIQHDATV